MPPRVPPPPSFPPPPPAIETFYAPIALAGQHVAACAVPGGCTFAYALTSTPVLSSTSPPSANQGDTLTVTGHGLSTIVSDNFVTVGGKPCAITSAANDASFTPGACPVTSCTQEMQTRTILTCVLPHHDTLVPHIVSAGVVGKGTSPALAVGGTVQYVSQLRAFEPVTGSLAGGTSVTLYGDGLSDRLGDLDVSIGGVRCALFAANASQVSCVTGAVVSAGAQAVALSVRGTVASCVPGTCLYNYAEAATPKLSGASIVSTTPTQWTVGLVGSGFLLPSSANSILLGGVTPCVPVGTADTATAVTCTCDPPLSGDQVVTLTNQNGAALGVPSLPTVRGVELSVSTLAPLNISLAGGAELTIDGGGFSAQDSRVTVCDKECAVTSVSSLRLTCTAPSVGASSHPSRLPRTHALHAPARLDSSSMAFHTPHTCLLPAASCLLPPSHLHLTRRPRPSLPSLVCLVAAAPPREWPPSPEPDQRL